MSQNNASLTSDQVEAVTARVMSAADAGKSLDAAAAGKIWADEQVAQLAAAMSCVEARLHTYVDCQKVRLGLNQT
jgi:hypothetical protein